MPATRWTANCAWTMGIGVWRESSIAGICLYWGIRCSAQAKGDTLPSWLKPKTPKQMKDFLGIVNWDSPCIKQRPNLVATLIPLLLPNGDVAAAHVASSVALFCFCDFVHPTDATCLFVRQLSPQRADCPPPLPAIEAQHQPLHKVSQRSLWHVMVLQTAFADDIFPTCQKC